MRALALLGLGCAACFSRADAMREPGVGWENRPATELVEAWGEPTWTSTGEHGTNMVWLRPSRAAPSANRRVVVAVSPASHAHPPKVPARFDRCVGSNCGFNYCEEPRRLDDRPEVKPTSIARIDRYGEVASVDGVIPAWSPPRGANLRWGAVLGLHVGLGLETTGTPAPSGGGYVGGMLGPRLGLVGTFSVIARPDDGGSALAGGLAAQWWPLERVWLRAGPAVVGAWDSERADDVWRPGAVASTSYALVKSGSYVLDVTLEAIGTADLVRGQLGFGISLN